MTLLLTSAGLAVIAALFAALGLGGAVVYVPLLATLGHPLATVAIPLGLLLNTLTSGRALAACLPHGWVDWRGLWPLAATTAASALAGAQLTDLIPPGELEAGLGLLLLAVAGWTLWRGEGHGAASLARAPAARRRWLSGGIGVGTGLLSGLFGIGGGVLIGPLLLALGYSSRRAAGSTALMSCTTSAAAFLGHLPRFQAPWTLTAAAVGAVLAGSTAGALWLRRTRRSHWVPLGYAALVAALGLRMLAA